MDIRQNFKKLMELDEHLEAACSELYYVHPKEREKYATEALFTARRMASELKWAMARDARTIAQDARIITVAEDADVF